MGVETRAMRQSRELNFGRRGAVNESGWTSMRMWVTRYAKNCWFRSFLLFVTFVVTSGCSHTITYKVVDSATRLPLSDVEMEVWTFKSPTIFLELPTRHQEARSFGPTDTNGIIKVDGLRGYGGWRNSASVMRDGYKRRTLIWFGNDGVGVYAPEGSSPIAIIQERDGVITLKLEASE